MDETDKLKIEDLAEGEDFVFFFDNHEGMDCTTVSLSPHPPHMTDGKICRVLFFEELPTGINVHLECEDEDFNSDYLVIE